MLNQNLSKGFAASLLSASLLLAGCGGGGGGGHSSSEASGYQGVAGPLDAAQEPLSTQVFGSLSDGVVGTPLESPVDCLNQVLVEDLLDVIDALAAIVDPASADDPQAALTAATENAQLAATELSTDLPNLLASLAGSGDCSSSDTAASGNPLEGTPLADLGSALEAAFAGGGDPSTMDLTQLAALFEQLSTAFSDGIAGVPAEVSDAPILGGALTTLDTALKDLATTTAAAADGDATATSTGISATLDNLLKNVLINVVPVSFLEEQSGQQGAFSAQIEAAVSELTAQLDSGLGAALAPLFEGFATLQDAITSAMSGGFGDGSGADPANGDMAALLAPLTELAATFDAGSGSEGVTGTPLDILLTPLVDAIESGGAAACPLVDTPLESACGVVDDLLATLALDPNADPVAVFEGLINSLVDSLMGLLG